MSIDYNDIADHVANGLTDAEIATALAENPPSRWFRTLSSREALDWLGGQRFAKMQDASVSTGIPEAIRGACAATLILLHRSDAALDLSPRSGHNNLLYACTSPGIELFSVGDVDDLVNSTRMHANPTEAQITRCILQHKLDNAILAANSAFARGEDWDGIVTAFSGEVA